jgi:hypothetical protein
MLAQNLTLSLPSVRKLGSWSPDKESSLEAWYQNKIGITLDGSDVKEWADSSTNGYDMVQATATHQPAYNASTGELTFDPADTNNLQTTGQVSLSGDFTIGFKLNVVGTGCVLADNTVVGEFASRITTSSNLRIRIDNTTAVNIGADTGNFAGSGYFILTRVSGVITLYYNGTAQTTTPTLTGTADIDTIGVRAADLNPFNGTVSEVQIYSSSNATLTTNVDNRLSSL